jgi:hypothetical protein
MTFLRDLISDLVTKRLWPVAVLLVAALIAVPVLVSKSAPTDQQAESTARTAAARAAKESAAAQPVVSLASSGSTAGQVRGLHAKDPFRRAKVKAAGNTVTVTPPSGSGGTGTGGTGTGGTGGGTQPPTTTPPATKTYVTYDVDLRFGQAASKKIHRNIARLTALPDSGDPVIIYMGIMSDGRTAVFLVNADATPQGDATCKPKKTECTYVYLHEGDTEFFDVGSGSAGTVQYELKVLHVDARKTTSQAAAAQSYARESRAGREVLRAESASLGYLHFSRYTGTLVPVDPSASGDADAHTG